MLLFDEFQNRCASAPPYRRCEFAFLNETGIDQGAPIRALFEEAFKFYTGNKDAIRARFRSLQNATHFGAAFELFLHELARRKSLQPLADAQVPGGNVDLQITRAGTGIAYIEARMLQPGENVHYSAACDAINRVKVQGIQLNLRLKRAPQHSLNLKALVTQLSAHLSTIDLATIATDPGENRASKFTYEEKEALFEILPVRSDSSPGGLGVSDYPDDELVEEEDIRLALERKNKKYGQMGHPYVVAICSSKGFATDEIFEDALFSTSPGDERGFFVRSKRSRVSGVLACQCFRPSSLSGARMRMYLNPNADHPLSDSVFGCDLAIRADDKFSIAHGSAVADIMGLPSGGYRSQ
ncbi:MAG: hypothetical protein ABL996_18860 [Micropepsaceae bacterium]